MDGTLRSLDEDIALDKRRNHTIEVDCGPGFSSSPGIREASSKPSIETATKLANGLVLISVVGGEDRLYSRKLACVECGTSVPELEPRSFSFNSPYGGLAEECSGIGQRPGAFDPGWCSAFCRATEVIADATKPLLEGGIGPAAASSRLIAPVEAAAKSLRIKLKTTPWEKLSLKTQKIF